MDSIRNIQLKWFWNLFLHVSHLRFLIEELIWNLFDFSINNVLALIVDEHELSLFASFITFWLSIEISQIFSIFNWDSFASSNEESLSIRWFITFASDFLALSMFDEKSKPFFPSFNFLSFYEITKINNAIFEVSNFQNIKNTYQFFPETIILVQPLRIECVQ